MNNKLLIGIILLCIILLISLYNHIRNKLNKDPIFIRKPHDASVPLTIPSNIIPKSPDGISYTILFWMKINDWKTKYGEWKHVLHKGDKNADYPQPGIWLEPEKNNLLIRYHTNGTIGNYGVHINKILNSIKPEKQSNVLSAGCKLDANSVSYNVKLEDLINHDKKNEFKGVTIFVKKDLINLDKNNSNEGPILTDNKGNQRYNPNFVVNKCLIKTQNTDKEDKLVFMENIEDDNGKEFVPITLIKQETVSLNPTSKNPIIDDTGMSNRVENIPINRWFHVGLIVNEYSSDIYIDGLLKSATTLENTIKPNEGDIYVCQSYNGNKPGFDGIINNLTVKTTSTSPEDILRIYQRGPDVINLPDINNLADNIIPEVSLDMNVSVKKA